MHDDEIQAPPDLVRRLIDSQFPRWSELSLARFDSAGSDNWMYRLGDELAVRLPRRPAAAARIAKEAKWLPKLAPTLPLAIPIPTEAGASTDEFPWAWSVQGWLPGDDLGEVRPASGEETAIELAGFLAALHVQSDEGPAFDDHNFYRGCPLRERAPVTEACLDQMVEVIDVDAAQAVWEAALDAAPWSEPGTWVHGDLNARNLLVKDAKLSAVIDFGGLGIGDPACDVMVAWTTLDSRSRRVFREALACDEAMWTRGRGWALSTAVVAWPYYAKSNPRFAEDCLATLREVLSAPE